MKGLFSTHGRIGRGEYALTVFTSVFLLNLLSIPSDLTEAGRVISIVVVSTLAALVTVFPAVKRLHDLGRPGSHYWLQFVPFYNLYLGFLLLFARGTQGENRFGPESTGWLLPKVEPGLGSSEGARRPGVVEVIWCSVLGLLLIIAVIMGTTSIDAFLSPQNLRALLSNLLLVGLLVPPMVLIVRSGGIDLSVGSLTALSSVIFVKALQAGAPVYSAAVLCLGVAFLAGLFHGTLIGVVRVPGVLVTLAGLLLYRQAGFALTQGQFLHVNLGDAAALERATLIKAADLFFPLTLACFCWAAWTALGKAGSQNAETPSSSAAQDLSIAAPYVAAAVLAGFCGIFLSVRLGGVGDASGRQGMELQVLAAVALGGTTFRTRGHVFGATLAAILLVVLENVLMIRGANFWTVQLWLGIALAAGLVVTQVVYHPVQLFVAHARVLGVVIITVLLLNNLIVSPLLGIATIVVYLMAAVIIGLLAARKNRDPWAWGLLGGNSLVIGLLILMFMPFLCRKCRQAVSNSDHKQEACPRCGDLKLSATA